ncbi:hypothetical protein ALC56_07459 [Trachymyrmex septentrionalis]|uniref:DNA-directed DNA polymerase n=1 Tax=Trachymyrmex septentrionalis TaxID=34720 RepID=A0A151JWA5_9HYME|nr:hypothetical protein ALC56_07459 [Trachymyrmex septentrionalis]
MESQSKEVEELPTKSSEKSLEQLLDEEEEDVFDETYMGSIIDLIYQTWITNTFIKNLRMMIGCIQTYTVKQRKIDPNTICMREAKTMKDALMSSYPDYTTVLNLEGIEFPVTLKQITKFELLNDISINVFTERERGGKKDDGNIIIPLRLIKEKKEKHVNLLYLQESRRDDENVIGCFTWIKNLSRLIGSQLNKNYLCDRSCRFTSLTVLQRTLVLFILPNENDKWLSFRDHNKKKRLLFVIYAYLECILEKKTNDENISRFIYQHHKVFSAGYYIRCVYDKIISIYKSYRGEDCVWFVKELYDLAHRAKIIFDKNVTMAEFTSNVKWENFRNATHCHICERPFEEGDLRVRDHCHLTGRYRGPAHSRCNLHYQDTYVISIFFHYLAGYDAHFIIKDIANSFAGRVDVLPITKENYISFTKHVKDTVNFKWRTDCVKLRFVDSFKFLNTSLEKLVSYLDKSKLKIIRSEFSNLDAEDFDLLTRKGMFPYEYIDSVDKLNETSLPPRELFYSSLTDETASDDDYQHATNVRRRFCIGTLGDYSDLYIKTDVLLLVDVFENFRDTCIENYGLDPTYYYTLPGYTWDAMLKYTGIRFELLTDIDMVMFVERGIRGG